MAEGGLGLETTELRLGLPAPGAARFDKNKKKRPFSEVSKESTELVGWPPVCLYKKNTIISDMNGSKSKASKKMYVKVSMDGVPILRKIDLGMLKAYCDLSSALEKLFGGADRFEFTPVYEDKDGDWMLAGDIPWDMFIGTCKRLRMIKTTNAGSFEVLRSRETINGILKNE
ncbi:indole-3-acetic acid inducible 19, MASSUGU 2 [Hibiscus trionum]|uniref:Auxin-responsive protein n=1 Tax=Hibiscus trionum TaxID=183268 RepID=A0A9W7MAV4_HIBTR|nr:indole-3-acetic acid inducible 19, MASSUGU 2 [Hibiscus trionum]